MTRTARCSCGQLQLRCPDTPVRVSLCHCLGCQQRTGSVFSVDEPDHVLVAVGAFADPGFPAPQVAVYEARRHAWTELPALAHIEHWD